MPYDLVIRNGIVVDGSGDEPRQADVAIAGGRVASVGVIDERGDEELDAEGHAVTPGFIDGHTHMDAQVMWDPLGTCSCWHGVTSVVMGNCGFTLAPARSDARDLVVRNIERAEDIAPQAMEAGIDWTWETFAEYLDAVEGRPKAINYAANVGHSALRVWAMGPRAFDEEANDDDLTAMREELRASLRAGAIGFTTSRNVAHQTRDGRPVASRLASWQELAQLVDVLRQERTGTFELAHGPDAQADDRGRRAAYFRTLAALALSSGVAVTFGTLPVRARYPEALACIDATRAAGGRMFGQSHSRGISNVLSFRTSLAFDALPEWQAVRRLAWPEQKAALRDADVRKRLIEAAHRSSYGGAVGAEPRRPDFALIKLFDHPLPPHRSVSEVAAERGLDPVELMIDLAVASDFDQLFVQPFGDYRDEDIVAVMRHPGTVMTFSDSGAHVSQIMDSSIQTHLLAYWVRERGEFTLAEAVQMMTKRAADAWGFHDRGLVREGYVADLNVIDPSSVGPAMPTVEYDLPGGARRLQQKATGIKATIVAGQTVLLDGEHTGVFPGQMLRGPWVVARRPATTS